MTPAHLAWEPSPPEQARLPDRPSRRSDDPLPARSEAPAPGRLHRARCACGRCGAHTFTNVGFTVGGSCPNCGSFDLVPVDGG